MHQSQARIVDAGKFGGVFQGIDGRFTAVDGNDQMFVHNRILLLHRLAAPFHQVRAKAVCAVSL